MKIQLYDLAGASMGEATIPGHADAQFFPSAVAIRVYTAEGRRLFLHRDKDEQTGLQSYGEIEVVLAEYGPKLDPPE